MYKMKMIINGFFVSVGGEVSPISLWCGGIIMVILVIIVKAIILILILIIEI